MFEEIQHFRHKLAADITCLGVGITFADPTVSEAIAPSADFLWIDLEHNPIGLESLAAHLLAARAASVPALVRTSGSLVSTIKPVLDTGATGLIVPQVRSADEVRSIVDACRYQPLGNRGFGPRRPTNYGRSATRAYLDRANRDLFVAVQIENAQALEDLEAIAQVPHLDSLVIGPYDLALSLGLDIQHPELQAAMARIVAAARRAELWVGIGLGPGDEVLARQAIALGVNWLQVGSDFNYMVHFADQLFARIRGGA